MIPFPDLDISFPNLIFLFVAIGLITVALTGTIPFSATNVESTSTAQLAYGDYPYAQCDGVSDSMKVYDYEISSDCQGVEAGGSRCLDRPQESQTVRNVRQAGIGSNGCTIWKYDKYRIDYGHCDGDGVNYCMCDSPDITSNVDNGDSYWADRWGCHNIVESDFNAIGTGGEGWSQRWVYVETRKFGGEVGSCSTFIGETAYPHEQRAQRDGLIVTNDPDDTQYAGVSCDGTTESQYDRDYNVWGILSVRVEIPSTAITGTIENISVAPEQNQVTYDVIIFNDYHPVSVDELNVRFNGHLQPVASNVRLGTGANRYEVSTDLEQYDQAKFYYGVNHSYDFTIHATGPAIPSSEVEGTPDFSGSFTDDEIDVPPGGWPLEDFQVSAQAVHTDVTYCSEIRNGRCIEEASAPFQLWYAVKGSVYRTIDAIHTKLYRLAISLPVLGDWLVEPPAEDPLPGAQTQQGLLSSILP